MEVFVICHKITIFRDAMKLIEHRSGTEVLGERILK